jgi:hypothetical protein
MPIDRLTQSPISLDARRLISLDVQEANDPRSPCNQHPQDPRSPCNQHPQEPRQPTVLRPCCIRKQWRRFVKFPSPRGREVPSCQGRLLDGRARPIDPKGACRLRVQGNAVRLTTRTPGTLGTTPAKDDSEWRLEGRWRSPFAGRRTSAPAAGVATLPRQYRRATWESRPLGTSSSTIQVRIVP